MVIYNVSIEERIAKLVSKSSQNSVNGNKGDEVHFTFDSEWQGHDKKVALFVWGGKYYPVEFTGNICTVPPLYNTNNFRLGVYVGETTDSETYLSSTEIEIPCKLSIRDFAKSSHGEVGKNYTYEAKGYAESAKISEENSKKSEENAKLSETNAYNSEVASKNSEISARNDAEIARQFAGNTEQIEARISRNDKRITNLEQGLVPSPFVTDDSVAYIKDVPLNALPYAEIKKIGGMIYKDADTLKHAKATEIKSEGANLFNDIEWFNRKGFTKQNDGSWRCHSLNEPCFANTSGRSGSMYINVNAKTENSGSVMYLRVYYTDGTGAIGCDVIPTTDFVTVSMTTDASKTVDYILWTYGSAGTYYVKGISISFVEGGYKPYVCNILSIPSEVQVENGINEDCYDSIEWDEKGESTRKIRVGEVDMGTLDWNHSSSVKGFFSSSNLPVDSVERSQGKCAPYTVVSKPYSNLANGEMIVRDPSYSSRSRVYVKDDRYTDGEIFKAAMSGVMLYYELATPEITNISDILPADNLIGVEGGGTIIAVNEHGYAVPTEITYQIKEATL